MNTIKIKASDNFEYFTVVRGFVDNVCIGTAKLTRDGAVAKLADIEIVDIEFRIFQFIPFVKRRLNYKGKGYGSQLLEATIRYCASQKIELIEGNVVGDMFFLIPWYKRHGFQVSEDNKITMRLNDNRGSSLTNHIL